MAGATAGLFFFFTKHSNYLSLALCYSDIYATDHCMPLRVSLFTTKAFSNQSAYFELSLWYCLRFCIYWFKLLFKGSIWMCIQECTNKLRSRKKFELKNHEMKLQYSYRRAKTMFSLAHTFINPSFHNCGFNYNFSLSSWVGHCLEHWVYACLPHEHNVFQWFQRGKLFQNVLPICEGELVVFLMSESACTT